MSGYTNGNVAECGKDADNYCEFVLIRLDLPFPADSTDEEYTRAADVRIDSFDPASVTDFDLHVYASDENGVVGDEIGFSGQPITDPVDRPEHVRFDVLSTRTYNPDGTVATESITTYVLAEIVYFWAPNSMYKGTAKFI